MIVYRTILELEYDYVVLQAHSMNLVRNTCQLLYTQRRVLFHLLSRVRPQLHGPTNKTRRAPAFPARPIQSKATQVVRTTTHAQNP